MVNYQVTAPPQLVALVARMKAADIKPALNTAADTFTPELAQALVDQANSSSVSGGDNRFTQAWGAISNGGPGITVANTFAKAKFVEFATRPHIIEPVRAKMLSWISPAGGRIFAKKVNHPGFGGYYVFETTILGKAADLWDIITAQVTRYLIQGK